jgi:Flp pilus assembly protein TadG
MKKLFKFAAQCDAQEIAELAVVLPILFSMIFGVFSFGRAYNIYSTVTRAAEEGAHIATAPVCATCAALSCGTFPCDSTVTQAVSSVLTASHLDPAQVTQLVPGSLTDCPAPAPAHTCTTPSLPSGSGQISVCRNVVLNTSTSNPALQSCGTIVGFQYSYQFIPVPFLTFNSIHIPARAQVGVEF